MQRSSEPIKVNNSGTGYALVKDKFNNEHRGNVHAKGKREIDIYFVSKL